MNEIKDSLFEDEESDQSILGALLLITGTCIGAGMLALPFVTGIAGFIPSLLIGFCCWLFMASTGLLFLEVTLWMPDGANILSMTERFFGKTGKFLGGILYLFLYYCLLVSYIDEGSPLFTAAIKELTGQHLPSYFSIIAFTAVFGILVLLGTRIVSHINWFLVAGLALSYLLLIGAGAQEVNSFFLKRSDWKLGLFSIPVLFSAYGYHNIIPTLSTYMKRDAGKLKFCIIVGTAIPFFIYSLWQWMVIGTIPLVILEVAAENNLRSYDLLQQVIQNPWIGTFGMYFAFFALVTSLLGVGLAMIDFLGDGLHVKRSGLTRLLLCLLVFIPPAVFAFLNPGVFVSAIKFSGGFGEAILNGLLPISMVWIGRYAMNIKSNFSLPGGRFTLGLLAILTALVMLLEFFT